jgi:hypothetical protein
MWSLAALREPAKSANLGAWRMNDHDLTIVTIRRVPRAEKPVLVRVRHRNGDQSEVLVGPDEELTIRMDKNEEIQIVDG